MGNLIVPNESKTPKEAILLGDITIQIQDCEGNLVDIHGLTANDLVVKQVGGEPIPLVQYVEQFASTRDNVTTSTVVSTGGTTYQLQELVDSYEQVQYDVADLQAKYNQN